MIQFFEETAVYDILKHISGTEKLRILYYGLI